MLAEITTLIPDSADTADEARFHSTEAALRFAFSNSVHASSKDSLAQHIGPGNGEPTDRLDNAAESGNIRRRIEAKLDDRQLQAVIAKFAPRAIPCSCRSPCCSGRRWNPEWAHAVRMLCEWSEEATREEVGENGRIISHVLLREGAVRRWAGGEKIRIGELADRCGVHRDTAAKRAKVIERWLKSALHVALNQADLALRG